jgi:hypothetical protein
MKRAPGADVAWGHREHCRCCALAFVHLSSCSPFLFVVSSPHLHTLFGRRRFNSPNFYTSKVQKGHVVSGGLQAWSRHVSCTPCLQHWSKISGVLHGSRRPLAARASAAGLRPLLQFRQGASGMTLPAPAAAAAISRLCVKKSHWGRKQFVSCRCLTHSTVVCTPALLLA